MKPYVILLRGINVGGKNKVSMAELKTYLAELGFEDVASYINSGNILLKSDKKPPRITQIIEEMLPKKFKLDSSIIRILVLSRDDLQEVISTAPKGFGTEPGVYHTDVIYLMGITPETVLPVFKPREGVDRIWPGKIVIYSQRLSARRTQSRLSVIAASPYYKSMTIRTWTTTTKLLNLLEEMGGQSL